MIQHVRFGELRTRCHAWLRSAWCHERTCQREAIAATYLKLSLRLTIFSCWPRLRPSPLKSVTPPRRPLAALSRRWWGCHLRHGVAVLISVAQTLQSPTSHFTNPSECFPLAGHAISALGHEQTSHHVRVMSVIPLKADIHQRGWHFRLVPEADLEHKDRCGYSATTPVNPAALAAFSSCSSDVTLLRSSDLPRAGGRLVWARPKCRLYRCHPRGELRLIRQAHPLSIFGGA